VIELGQPPGVRPRRPERAGQVFGSEGQQLPHRQRRAQGSASRCRHEAPLEKRRLRSQPDPQRSFVTADRGFQQRPAARILLFRDRDHRRQDRRARVMHRADMRIVEVAGVGVGAIDESGPARIEAISRQEQAAAAGSSQLQGEPARGHAPRQRSPDGDHPQQIEHQRFHPLDYRGRRIVEPKTCSPFGQDGRRSLVHVCRHEVAATQLEQQSNRGQTQLSPISIRGAAPCATSTASGS